MSKDITKLLWWNNSYFIKQKEWKKDFPEKLKPEAMGEPFQIHYPLDKDSLKEQILEKYPEANAYTEGTVSIHGFSEPICQAYRI